jgi:hypothetical protein
MTLNEQLREKLAKERVEGPRQTLTVAHADSGWTVDIVADNVETIGVRVWEIALRQNKTANRPALAEQAKHIAGRVTGLMEPLRIVEVDEPRDMAQLRSTAPATQGDALLYYEVLRQTNGATSIRRYQASTASGKREQTAFTLTHEALVKLVGDLASV